MATLEDLKTRRAALDQQIEAATIKNKAAAIARITAAMKSEGLLLADLAPAVTIPKGAAVVKPAKPRKPKAAAVQLTPEGDKVKANADKRKGKVAAKFRDPVTGTTWTGRGRTPKWVLAATANGKTADDFSIAR